MAHFIGKEGESQSVPKFPFLCLTVSGGHTQIVLVHDHLDMKVIGETMDDAAGEAFDKAAKIMGLSYPGGPIIDRLASSGNPAAFKFPHPKVKKYNYSFSGLKTAFLYFIQGQIKADPQFIEVHKETSYKQRHFIPQDNSFASWIINGKKYYYKDTFKIQDTKGNIHEFRHKDLMENSHEEQYIIASKTYNFKVSDVTFSGEKERIYYEPLSDLEIVQAST